MGKSYWFKDWSEDNGQRGNFSNDKQDTFNLKNDFIGVRLQQGVPLLDRDWNELEDIRRYQDVMLRKHYLGNGTPNDGFRVFALDSPANDFMISAGRFLVDGFEAVNEPDGANFILYSSQPGAPALTKVAQGSGPRVDTVYLDVWIEEVTAEDLGPDSWLGNPDDIAMETCIRHRLRWFVRVDEGNGHSPGEGHHFYDLANITRTSARDTIGSADIKDLRSGWQSLDATQSRLRNAINSMLSGNMPSDPVIDLATLPPSSGEENYIPVNLVKDGMGSMILFWQVNNNLWAKRYSASYRTWSTETQITSGNTSKDYYNAFYDSAGDIQVFWRQWDANSQVWSLRFKKYSTSTGVWTGDAQLTSPGAAYDSFLKAFEDNSGNTWIFWSRYEAGSYNFFAKNCIAGNWSEDIPLTSGTTYKSFDDVYVDSNGNIWFFWSQTDANVYSLWSKRYSAGSWTDFQLTSSTTYSYYIRSFDDGKGNIWLFWNQEDEQSQNQIWAKRFSSGSWGGDTRLTSGTANSYYVNSFVDIRGDIWLFWEQADSTYNAWAKRYTSDAWSGDMQLTSGTYYKYNFYSLAGIKRDVWFFWDQANESNVYDICYQRFDFDYDTWESSQITQGDGDKYISSVFAFSNGNIGIFWVQDNYYVFKIFDRWWRNSLQIANSTNSYIYKTFGKSNGDLWLLLGRPPYNNIWCTKFIDGDFVGESRLINDAVDKDIIDVFEDVTGDVWAFWMAYSSIQSPSRHIKCKRIYGSI